MARGYDACYYTCIEMDERSMAEPARKPRQNLYLSDFLAWSQEQGRLLKARSSAGLDWDNLAEEIETLGRSERNEIRSRLVVLLQHLLKWQFQPSRRKPGWAASILEARDGINVQLEESPSLKRYPETVVDRQYRIARLKAADETGLPVEAFPAECPYTLNQILDEAFLPASEV